MGTPVGTLVGGFVGTFTDQFAMRRAKCDPSFG